MESPCRDICLLDPARAYCTGCGRTLDQIGRWADMSDPERARIMAALALPSREDLASAPEYAESRPHLPLAINEGDSQ